MELVHREIMDPDDAAFQWWIRHLGPHQDANGVKPPLPLGREKLRSLRVFGYGASEAGQAAPSAHPYTTTPLRH